MVVNIQKYKIANISFQVFFLENSFYIKPGNKILIIVLLMTFGIDHIISNIINLILFIITNLEFWLYIISLSLFCYIFFQH